MKNMKVSMKLIVSFLIVAALTASVGIVGISGMRSVDSAIEEMYVMQTVPLPDLAEVGELLQRQRACMREFIIGAAVNDIALLEDANDRAEEYRLAMLGYLDAYRKTIKSDEALRLFDEAVVLYNTDFKECMDLIYTLAAQNTDAGELYAIMREYTPAVNQIVDNFDRCMELKVENAAAANIEATATSDRMLFIIIAVLAVAISVSVFFALYISNLISKPLSLLAAFMNKAGTSGDLSLSDEDIAIIGEYSKVKDEVGQTINNAASFVGHVTNISQKLEIIAAGDLSVELEPLSDKDTMGLSLNNMINNLNSMFGEVNSATEQVSTASKQIADGAQLLAQGSTEQAASIEELSSSITEIAEKTKENAEMAGRAASFADRIMSSAQKGSQQMDEMMDAVKEINAASHDINKVIKVIDDIAFQTNILALNAAVEAARAGQHGKGFAVVAEEVRNLAAKSADAARETSDMIQNSIDKAELGSRIANETADSLTEIVTGITESSALINDIAKSSDEQSSGIIMINNGIEQVAQVVSQNSATAQQSAAASEEMSGQSSLLHDLIAQFKLKEQETIFYSLPSSDDHPDKYFAAS